VRITLSRVIALSAVLILPVACGGADESPAAEVSSVAPSASPAELTVGNFAPRVLAALEAKGRFRVDGALIVKGQREEMRLTADVRMEDGVTDVALVSGDVSLARLGNAVYLRDEALTGSTKRPWAKLNPRSKNAAEREAIDMAKAMIGVALAHQVIGGTTYATDVKRGGQIMIDGGDETQEYIFTIDLHKAAAADALGELLGQRIARTPRGGLSVSIAIDRNDLPRRIEYVMIKSTGFTATVRVTLGAFGEDVPIAAPPTAEIGKVS
jgi:hypothetical protein